MPIKIKFEIQGMSDILMHKFITENTNGLTEQEQAEKVAYRNENNELYAPNTWIYRSMVEGGKQVTPYFGKRMTMSKLVAGGVTVIPSQLSFGVKDYIIDKRPVVIPSTRGRIVRCRPKIFNWKLSGEILVIDERLCKPEGIKNLRETFDVAGAFIGIGDGRSEGHGRFTVTKFEVIKT